MFRVGVAQVDITPEEGAQLAGNVGVHRPSQVVSDLLYSKALILESGGKRVCFVTLDLCITTKYYRDQIRKAIAEKFGFDLQAVMIHTLQTHSAPALGHFMVADDFEGIPKEFDWLRGGDESYSRFVIPRILESVSLANKALEPVKIGVGSGIEGRMAFNRRAVTREGTVMIPWFWNPRAQPLGWKEIRYLEGPADPEVGVVCFRTNSLHFPSILVNYTCHPVVVYGNDDFGRVVSADWPGALAEELVCAYEDCVPLILNGPCGNINPWNPFDSEYTGDHRHMGKVLAEMVKKIIERMTFEEEIVLDWKSDCLRIPIRKVNDEEVEEAKKILKENPSPIWTNEKRTRVDLKWYNAVLTLNRHFIQQREVELDYEIQAFRIGKAAFVCLPGEPFVEGGLRIKLASPTYQTYIVHNTYYAGYVPTKEAFERGGHEIKWSLLVPEALDTICTNAVNLLEEIF